MKKFNLLLIFLFIISLFSITRIYGYVNGYVLLGKVFYIDPGHGGIDSGTSYKNILEKDINLEISIKLARELSKYGAIVYLTRDTDKDLATTRNNRKRSDLLNRAYLINKVNPDMYISIHQNYIASSKWKGMQIFYSDKNSKNKDIAISMTKYLKEVSSNIRECRENNTYLMYKYIESPGVLIETGFLSNPDDRYRLNNSKYQDIIVKNITYGIINYYMYYIEYN